MAFSVPTVTIDDLRAFHAKHFSHVQVPEIFLHGTAQETAQEEYEEDVDELGYYSDGVKRTLTDEQIAIFRHSEIQAILRKRRQQRCEDSNDDSGLPTIASSTANSERESKTATSNARSPSTQANNTAEPTSVIAANSVKVQNGRVIKLLTPQWATTSARTKARNKRQRSNYKANKRERKIMEREADQRSSARMSDGEVSDEWDPWHQANGPDNQKADAVDLNY